MHDKQMHKKIIVKSLGYLFFIFGAVIALDFSYTQLSELFTKLKSLSATIESNQSAFQFNCKDEDCQRCFSGVRNNPDAILFTGGSSFRYGLDMEKFSKSFDRPVVNCIKNDTRVDAYTTFFKYIQNKNSEQIVFHGYNSWAVNSAGTWTEEKNASLRSWFNLKTDNSDFSSNPIVSKTKNIIKSLKHQYEAYLIYTTIFHTRISAELPNYWRLILGAKHPIYQRNDLAYWPLTKQEHKDRKFKMMQQWIHKSPWAQSFMIDVDKVQSETSIISRYEAFAQAIQPRQYIYFFPAPELKQIFPADMLNVFRLSKNIFLDYAHNQSNISHLEIDYEKCGVTKDDFWFESIKIYDPAHPNDLAKNKITKCIVDALAVEVNHVKKN